MTDYRIAGSGLAATARDGAGGKITSLTDARGLEWLAQASSPTEAGTRFVDGEMSGWDECAPTVDACLVDGVELPDHGDLWAASWETTEHTSELLEMRATGTSLGYELVRRITPCERGLRVDYEARALARDLPFMWVAHPQFSAPSGTYVTLPVGIRSVVDVLGDGDRALPWSEELATADTLLAGGFRKVYVDPTLRATHATLVRPGGSTLTLAWTGCDYLGLWFDRAAFSRETVIALEPSTGYRDSLAWAIENGTATTLSPGHPLHWMLELSVAT